MTCADKNRDSSIPKIEFYRHATLDSTSSEARRHLNGGKKPPFAVIADSQSAGRGRQGKSFLSPFGGLYVSFAISAPSENVLSLTTRACVALVRAIRRMTDADVKIKWVNDVWLGDKKLAGILTEAVGTPDGDAVIIGIGVNLSRDSIPTEISDIATALPDGASTRDALSYAIWEELYSLTRDTSDNGYLNEYRGLSLVLGREISYTENGVTKTGVATKILDDGSLTVEVGGDTVTLSSGEITVRMQKG